MAPWATRLSQRVAIAAMLVIAGPWMLKLIVDYTRALFPSSPQLVS